MAEWIGLYREDILGSPIKLQSFRRNTTAARSDQTSAKGSIAAGAEVDRYGGLSRIALLPDQIVSSEHLRRERLKEKSNKHAGNPKLPSDALKSGFSHVLPSV